LHDISFSVAESESLAIVGASGSGKSTLLGLLAGLDTPTSGQVHLMDKDISAANEDQRAQIRSQHVGFVFQSFQLIDHLSALENDYTFDGKA
jgi:putative ABC transport system ATP-binding protein